MRHARWFRRDARTHAHLIQQRRSRETIRRQTAIGLEAAYRRPRRRAKQPIGIARLIAQAIQQRLQFEDLFAVERARRRRPTRHQTAPSFERAPKQRHNERVAIRIVVAADHTEVVMQQQNRPVCARGQKELRLQPR